MKVYIYKPKSLTGKTLTGKTITLYTIPMQIIFPYSVEVAIHCFNSTLQKRRIF